MYLNRGLDGARTTAVRHHYKDLSRTILKSINNFPKKDNSVAFGPLAFASDPLDFGHQAMISALEQPMHLPPTERLTT